MTLRLAEAAGLTSAKARLCHWDDGESRHKGLIVKLFIDEPHEGLALGSQVLFGNQPNESDARLQHTPRRAYMALFELEVRGLGVFLLDFLKMVAFDAWIGNGDRHSENWGIVVGGNRWRLAPMFDPASCLGA